MRRFWTNCSRDLLNLCVRLLRPLVLVGMRITPALEGKKSFEKRLTTCRKFGRLTNCCTFFLPGLGIQGQKPSTFTTTFVDTTGWWLLYGSFEELQHYQGTKHFAWDQRVHMELPRWSMLNFTGIPRPQEKIGPQRTKSMRKLLLRKYQEYLLFEDLITDELCVVDHQLPVQTKM